MAGTPRVLLVVARYYEDIAAELEAGAAGALEAAGVKWDSVAVPGALEIPGAIASAHRFGAYDGYVALGCVIRGETGHYDIVAGESARGLTNLAIDHGAALGNGILTTENREQAMKRAAVAQGNKGAVAAEACLALIGLARRFAGDA